VIIHARLVLESSLAVWTLKPLIQRILVDLQVRVQSMLRVERLVADVAQELLVILMHCLVVHSQPSLALEQLVALCAANLNPAVHLLDVRAQVARCGKSHGALVAHEGQLRGVLNHVLLHFVPHVSRPPANVALKLAVLFGAALVLIDEMLLQLGAANKVQAAVEAKENFLLGMLGLVVNEEILETPSDLNLLAENAAELVVRRVVLDDVIDVGREMVGCSLALAASPLVLGLV
jgi:hypothetical protein